MRAFKTVNDSYIEPISFIVPRRAEVFQDDIFPPVIGSSPAMTSQEWFDGKEGLPPKIDLGSIYAGEEPTEITAAEASTSKSLTSMKSQPQTEQEPEPPKQALQPLATSRGPPPSMKEQTSSISNLASKFADKDDADSDQDMDEDSSSFEEVPKPVDRSERNIPKLDEKPIANAGLSSTSPQKSQAEPILQSASELKVYPSLFLYPPNQR